MTTPPSDQPRRINSRLILLLTGLTLIICATVILTDIVSPRIRAPAPAKPH